jgi:hypothetical protein
MSFQYHYGYYHNNFRCCNIGIIELRDLSSTPLGWLHFCMMYIPSFMNIDTGVQEIVRFFLRNLRGCNIGIIDGRGL